MSDPVFVCESCGVAAETVIVNGKPDLVRCPACGHCHAFDELYVFVPKLAKAVARKVVQDMLRSRRRRTQFVRETAHGFRIEIKVTR